MASIDTGFTAELAGDGSNFWGLGTDEIAFALPEFNWASASPGAAGGWLADVGEGFSGAADFSSLLGSVIPELRIPLTLLQSPVINAATGFQQSWVNSLLGESGVLPVGAMSSEAAVPASQSVAGSRTVALSREHKKDTCFDDWNPRPEWQAAPRYEKKDFDPSGVTAPDAQGYVGAMNVFNFTGSNNAIVLHGPVDTAGRYAFAADTYSRYYDQAIKNGEALKASGIPVPTMTRALVEYHEFDGSDQWKWNIDACVPALVLEDVNSPFVGSNTKLPLLNPIAKQQALFELSAIQSRLVTDKITAPYAPPTVLINAWGNVSILPPHMPIELGGQQEIPFEGDSFTPPSDKFARSINNVLQQLTGGQ